MKITIQLEVEDIPEQYVKPTDEERRTKSCGWRECRCGSLSFWVLKRVPYPQYPHNDPKLDRQAALPLVVCTLCNKILAAQ